MGMQGELAGGRRLRVRVAAGVRAYTRRRSCALLSVKNTNAARALHSCAHVAMHMRWAALCPRSEEAGADHQHHSSAKRGVRRAGGAQVGRGEVGGQVVPQRAGGARRKRVPPALISRDVRDARCESDVQVTVGRGAVAAQTGAAEEAASVGRGP